MTLNPYSHIPGGAAGGQVIDNLVTLFTFKADLAGAVAVQQAVKAIQTDFNALGKKLVLWGGSTALANFGNLAAFSGVEKNLAKIDALVGINVDHMQKRFNELSVETGKGQADVVEAMFFAMSAGLRDTEEAFKAVRAAAIGSEAGLGDMTTLVDVITDAVNAFGAANLSAMDAMDTITEGVRLGKFEPAELAESLGRALPFAAALNVEFSEVVGILAAMSRTGTDTAEAVTSIRQVMRSLLNPSAGARSALKAVGMTVDALREAIQDRGLFAALQMLHAAVDGDAEKLAQIFPNIRALTGIFDLFGANLPANLVILEDMRDSVGETTRAFDIMEATVSDKFLDMLRHIEEFAVGIGRAIAPIGHAVLNVASPVVQFFRQLTNSMNPVVDTLIRIWASVGALVAILGALIIVLNAASVGFAALNVFKYALRGLSVGFGGRESRAAQAAGIVGGMGYGAMASQLVSKDIRGIRRIWRLVGVRAGLAFGLGMRAIIGGYTFWRRILTDPRQAAMQYFINRGRRWAHAQGRRARTWLRGEAAEFGGRAGAAARRRFENAARRARMREARARGGPTAGWAAGSYENLREARRRAAFWAAREDQNTWQTVTLPSGGTWRRQRTDSESRRRAYQAGAQRMRYEEAAFVASDLRNRERRQRKIDAMRARRARRMADQRFKRFHNDFKRARSQHRAGAASLAGLFGFGGFFQGEKARAGATPKNVLRMRQQLRALSARMARLGILQPAIVWAAFEMAVAFFKVSAALRASSSAMRVWNAMLLTNRTILKGLKYAWTALAATMRFAFITVGLGAVKVMTLAMLKLLVVTIKVAAAMLIAMLANPIGLAITAVAVLLGLVAAVGTWWNQIAKFIASLPWPLQVLLAPITLLLRGLKEIWDAIVHIWNNFDEVRESISRVASATTRWIRDFLGPLGFIVDWLSDIVEHLTTLYNIIGRWWDREFNQPVLGTSSYEEGGIRTTGVRSLGGDYVPITRGYGYARGGIVPGRSWQSVPAVLHGGEAVLPARLTRTLMAAGAGGRNMTVNVEFDEGSVVVNDATDAKMVAKAIVGSVEDEIRNLGYAYDSAVDT